MTGGSPETVDAQGGNSTELDEILAVDPAVGADLAAVDWAATPVGPPATWPQSLRTAVSILLSSRFSMWMAWGPELTFFCNDAYRRDTLGKKYPWALGRPSAEVWAEIWDDIGPRIATVLTAGTATWDEALLLFVERSGYPEESYHTFSYSPLRSDTGTVVGMLCVVSEDTERVIGERRMATLRDLGSDPGVVRTERETVEDACRHLARNSEDLPFTLTYLFDDEGASLAGTTGIAAGHPAAPERLAPDSAIWPVTDPRQGRPALVELAGVGAELPTGAWSEPPTRALLVPLLRQGDEPYGFLVAGLNRYRTLDEEYRGFVELVAGHLAARIAGARSYREQQQRADALAELDRAKTTFFSNISHEFRTPLTLISGPVEDLRSRCGDLDDRARDELDVIHRNTLRLGKLVNSLLDFSRIEAGRMQARFEPVDLATVTTGLASVFRSAIERAGLRFEVDCPDLSEPVYVDRGLWEKVVLNLLSNALKFTFEGGIAVRVRADGTDAVVSVTDSGVGVPAAELPRLFERFHRIENVRSRSSEGSGIGLAMVRELVELHGGTITADSSPDRGTTFTVRIPFGTAHLPAESLGVADDARPVGTLAEPYLQEASRWLPAGDRVPPVTAAESDPGPVPARVLVADDNPDMREYMVRLLTDAGYQVGTVTDGVDALAIARSQTPDIVISDVMMPRLDGLSLAAALRADPRTASTPVLLLSARAGQEASIEGLQAGADDYLVKPFAAAELLARVRANVELARMRARHTRWRTALVDSLQEAFFVCDENGAVIEINTAFTDILGFGSDELPYKVIHPWWPDADLDPDGHRQVSDAFVGLLEPAEGSSFTIPVIHRDGHRLWISAHFQPTTDPETGRRVTVGTFRDVTAEHYAVQREAALASLNTRLLEATSMSDAISGAVHELRSLWRAEKVAAAVFDGGPEPEVVCTIPGMTWGELSTETKELLQELRKQPLLTTRTGRTGTGVLLAHPHGLLGLWIRTGVRAPFTENDRILLSLLGGRLAQGLTRVHHNDQQRETAIALQRAILGPAQMLDGFAVRYEPATRRLEVGGDWYDTVPLPSGRIGIVVGDCVGHGLPAATVMGQLRSACRALLLQDTSPAHTLMALDRFASTIEGAACTTVFCAVLDPDTGRLSYSSAGHPPGILAVPDGSIRLLEDGRSLPLAVRPGTSRPEAECVIPADATLLLYTDGLVERRRRPIDEGIDRAGEAVQAGRDTGLDDLADDVMARLVPAGGYDDDVALLLYRRFAPPESID